MNADETLQMRFGTRQPRHETHCASICVHLRSLLSAFICVSSLILPAAAQQPDYSKVEIKTTKLSDTAYMMEGAGGNLGLSIGEDAVFVIDDQFAPLSEKITAAIAKITPKPVRFILNTHWHSDHTGGNEKFAGTGAIILAHENVRKRMGSDQLIEFFRQTVPASRGAALPIVTFAGAVTFYLNGDEMRVMHVPRAHTDGDAIVHFVKSDVIHTGDIYFNGMYPFIDTSSGGTVDGMIAACDQMLRIASDTTKIIPGHGPLSNKAELAAYRGMLITVAARVRKLAQEGKTPEQIGASDVLADLDPKWGKGFVRGPLFAGMVADNFLNAK